MEPFLPLTLPFFFSSRRLRPRRRHLQITVTVVPVAVAPLVTPACDGEEIRRGVIEEEGDFFTTSLNLSLFRLWRLRTIGILWTVVSI